MKIRVGWTVQLTTINHKSNAKPFLFSKAFFVSHKGDTHFFTKYVKTHLVSNYLSHLKQLELKRKKTVRGKRNEERKG